MRTALVVVVDAPEAADVYRRTYPDAVARGIPLHVTVLFPFVPADALEDALPRVKEALAAHAPFEFALTRLETFPDHVWLAPEPDEPFRALTRSLHAAFPDYPPYGGVFEDVVPHATMTSVDEHELADAVAAITPQVEPLLPVAARADAVAVLREDAPDRWRQATRLPLGGRS